MRDISANKINEAVPDVFVVPPRGISLEYEINDLMDKDQEVDPVEAGRQWNNYVQKLQEAGLEVEVLNTRDQEFVEGEWPDIVFAANHGYAFSDKGETKLLLSNMKHDERAGEIDIVRKMLGNEGIETIGPTKNVFEGEGDIVDHPEEGKVWAGYGERTEKAALKEFEAITGYETVPLELRNECFHLDTCLSHIDYDTALAYPSGIGNYSLIEATYGTVIEVPEEEGKNLAANAYFPDEKTVIINSGNHKTANKLRNRGFKVETVEMDQPALLGGSASCMKLEL